MIINDDNKKWIEEEFEGVELGESRRVARLMKIAQDFEGCIEGSILEASQNWGNAKGAYRFFGSEIDPKKIMAGHLEKTIERIGQKKIVLALQDTTTLNFTSHRATTGLGQIGPNNAENKGFFCHCTLAVDEEGLPLGVLKAETYVRAETKLKRKRGPQAHECESGRWLDSLSVCQQVSDRQPGTRIVNIGDRESDFYEYISHAALQTPSVSYLIRAAYDRQNGEGLPTLFEEVGLQKSRGILEVEVPRKPGTKARKAKLEIRFCKIELGAPAHWNREYKESPPLTLWIIEARENPKSGAGEPICWRLLTNLPIESFEQAVEKVRWYCKRWCIEIFFRVLKSGCKIEERQLETRARLERVLMLDLIMDWRVLFLMWMGRNAPSVSAQALFEEAERKALCCYEQGNAKAPAVPPTLGEAMRMVAKLGGFLGRKGDGNPGAEVLWRGLRRLDDITAAYVAFTK